MLIKVSNLFKSSGECDYKGLNIDKIIPGTQLYPIGTSDAYFEYDGNLVEHADLKVLHIDDYLAIKYAMDIAPKPLSDVDTLKLQVAAQTEVTNSIVEKSLTADVVYNNADIDSVTLEELKILKINQLDHFCTLTILNGFTSEALGSPHQYGFDEQDQSNLTGRFALVTGDPSYPETFYWKTKNEGPLPHNKQQFLIVCRDADSNKDAMISKYWGLKLHVKNLLTKEAVAAINWE